MNIRLIDCETFVKHDNEDVIYDRVWENCIKYELIQRIRMEDGRLVIF